MAFIAPSACSSPRPQKQATGERSRRDFLQIASIGVLATFLPRVTKAEEPALPPGAAQFSRLLAAQRQWSGVSKVLEQGDLSDADWENLRGYLRTVYAISGDMEFIAKPWDKSLKDQGFAVATRFRTTVKGMDKPALKKDIVEFKRMHEDVVGIFNEYFDVFKNATVSDIPDEL